MSSLNLHFIETKKKLTRLMANSIFLKLMETFLQQVAVSPLFEDSSLQFITLGLCQATHNSC